MTSTITEEECLQHLQRFIDHEKKGLRRFFDDAALTEKATIGTAMITQLLADGCGKQVAKDLAILTLYDIVVLVDDSVSMEIEEGGTRKETLETAFKEITNVYDYANPTGILSVRFLNTWRGRRNVKRTKVEDLFHGHEYRGVTKIGTALERKVLKRLVFNGIPMTKPLLVVIIADGAVEGERRRLVNDVIINCVTQLGKANPDWGEDAIAFQFSRIGNDEGAVMLLLGLMTGYTIRQYVSCLPVALEHLSNPAYKWSLLPKLLLGAIVPNWKVTKLACYFNPETVSQDNNYTPKLDSAKSEVVPHNNTSNPIPDPAEPNEILHNDPDFKLNRYKLETTFSEDEKSVVHTTYMSDLLSRERRVAVETRWEDRGELGRGGFGCVTLQKNEQGLYRAVKKLTLNQGNVVDFCMELKALSKVLDRTDLFVEFFGWYKGKSAVYIAMEFIEYGHLGEYMESEGAKSNTREITKQVLEGLAVLHSKNICHRDLKPENILIASPQPIWVKIGDFGASKYLKGTQLETRIGTPGYLAPELFPVKGGARTPYTNAIDLWGLGCIVHQMLTLKMPFSLPTAPPSSTMSGLISEIAPSIPQPDEELYWGFCMGKIPFPEESLQKSGASDSEIAFTKSLLIVEPSLRLTASAALKTPWILEGNYTNDPVGPQKSVTSGELSRLRGL